jgi:hypothetical protein
MAGDVICYDTSDGRFNCSKGDEVFMFACSTAATGVDPSGGGITRSINGTDVTVVEVNSAAAWGTGAWAALLAAGAAVLAA